MTQFIIIAKGGYILDEIKKITPEEASVIIETRKPEGQFYLIDSIQGKRVYVGIDNSTGDAWTEDFKSLPACKRWLLKG
jgi:hypothetical protein